MSDIKTKSQGIEPSIVSRDILTLVSDTQNIYKSLSIISKRAKQLSVEVRKELNGKLDEFASNTDSLEEIHENKEQIEISKFYERMPNSAILAMHEFLNEELNYRNRDEK